MQKSKGIAGKKGVKYEEIDISMNEIEMREKLIEMTGGQRTVPQIFINEKPIGGSDDLARLYTSGELDKLLAE